MFKFFSLLLISVSYLFADNPNPSSFDDFDLIVVDQDANEVVIQNGTYVVRFEGGYMKITIRGSRYTYMENIYGSTSYSSGTVYNGKLYAEGVLEMGRVYSTYLTYGGTKFTKQ